MVDMSKFLPDKLTPLSGQDVVTAFFTAFINETHAWISDEGLAVFVAHSALETGRWKSIHWNDFGNIKRGKYDGFWTMFRCNEIIGGKVQWFDPPDPQTWFRAYKTAAGGALEHFAFLHQQKRWQKAWDAAIAGDADAFCRALKAAGYFTAELEPYRRSVVSLQKTYLPIVKAVPKPVQCEPLEPCFIDDDTVHSPSSDEDLRRLLTLLPEPEFDWDLIMADKTRDVLEALDDT